MALISLAEWAVQHGIHPDSARQKALRGGFQTARKIGRNWVIEQDEPNIDLRWKQNMEKHRAAKEAMNAKKE